MREILIFENSEKILFLAQLCALCGCMNYVLYRNVY